MCEQEFKEYEEKMEKYLKLDKKHMKLSLLLQDTKKGDHICPYCSSEFDRERKKEELHNLLLQMNKIGVQGKYISYDIDGEEIIL